MHFAVREFPNFEALWPSLMDMNHTYLTTLNIPVRVVLSSMPAESWPATLETVFSVDELRN